MNNLKLWCKKVDNKNTQQFSCGPQSCNLWPKQVSETASVAKTLWNHKPQHICVPYLEWHWLSGPTLSFIWWSEFGFLCQIAKKYITLKWNTLALMQHHSSVWSHHSLISLNVLLKASSEGLHITRNSLSILSYLNL